MTHRPIGVYSHKKDTFLTDIKPDRIQVPAIPLSMIYSDRGDYIATVVLEAEYDDRYDNQIRLGILESVVSSLVKWYLNNGIVIFPAGMFFTDQKPPSLLYPQLRIALSNYLATIPGNIIVCFGIDGSEDPEGYARDQIAVAADRTGIIALGRKFHPQKGERNHVNLAGGFNVLEDGKCRIFRFLEKSYYLAMCYDSFGIKNLDIKNPGVQGIIELAHRFNPRPHERSGESDFARHGFAGIARQWNCTAYGTGVFFRRRVPERWPTGVIWNQGTISTKDWKYEMNPLKPDKVTRMSVTDGAAVIRLFQV